MRVKDYVLVCRSQKCTAYIELRGGNTPITMRYTSNSPVLLWYLSRVLLPIVRAARMARENLDDDPDDMVRALLIRSMARMTVARLGTPQEKNSITSLKI